MQSQNIDLTKLSSVNEEKYLSLKDCLQGKDFEGYRIPICLGRDMNKKIIIKDLKETGNLLIAGATGSGKSIFMDSILCTLLIEKKPEEIKLVLIDSLDLDFNQYEGVPYLAYPIMTNVGIHEWMDTISWCLSEVERREITNITEPNIVVFISQFSALLLNFEDAESQICKLAIEGPKVGIYLIMHTSRPAPHIFTPQIKGYFNAKVGFNLTSEQDSITVLDQKGAEDLNGMGDMLYKDKQIKEAIRLQAPYVSFDDIDMIVNKVSSRECLCDDPSCIKCLLINCEDDSCIKHTKEKKLALRKQYYYPKIKQLIESGIRISPQIMKKIFHMNYYKGITFLNEFWDDEINNFPYVYRKVDELNKSGKPITVRTLQEEFSMSSLHAYKLLKIIEHTN